MSCIFNPYINTTTIVFMFKYVVAHFEEKWVLGLGSLTKLGSSTLRYVDVIWFVYSCSPMSTN